MRSRLISTGAFFWFYYGASAMVAPFLTLYLQRNGLSPSTAGFVMAAQSLVAVVGAPLWGMLEDRNRTRRSILECLLVVSAGIGIVLYARPPLFVIISLTVLFAMVDAGTAPLADRLALSVIRTAGSGNYGSVRVFGSLGWICAAPLAGLLADHHTISFLFLGFVGFVLPAALLAHVVSQDLVPQEVAPDRPIPEEPLSLFSAPEHHPGGRVAGIRALGPLIVALVLHQFFARSLFRYEPLYLDSLGVSTMMIGLTASIPALVELAGMPLASRLESKVGSWWIVLTGIGLFVVRMVLVRIWPVVSLIIVSKVLDGLEFSFVLVGTVGLVTTGEGHRSIATRLALVTVSMPQVVMFVALPVTGSLYERYGGVLIYTFAGICSTAAVLVLLMAITASHIRLQSRSSS